MIPRMYGMVTTCYTMEPMSYHGTERFSCATKKTKYKNTLKVL